MRRIGTEKLPRRTQSGLDVAVRLLGERDADCVALRPPRASALVTAPDQERRPRDTPQLSQQVRFQTLYASAYRAASSVARRPAAQSPRRRDPASDRADPTATGAPRSARTQARPPPRDALIGDVVLGAADQPWTARRRSLSLACRPSWSACTRWRSRSRRRRPKLQQTQAARWSTFESRLWKTPLRSGRSRAARWCREPTAIAAPRSAPGQGLASSA